MEIVTDVQESRSPSVVDERAWNPLLSNFVISLERIAYQFKKTCERPVLLYTFLDIFFHDIHIYIYMEDWIYEKKGFDPTVRSNCVRRVTLIGFIDALTAFIALERS